MDGTLDRAAGLLCPKPGESGILNSSFLSQHIGSEIAMRPLSCPIHGMRRQRESFHAFASVDFSRSNHVYFRANASV